MPVRSGLLGAKTFVGTRKPPAINSATAGHSTIASKTAPRPRPSPRRASPSGRGLSRQGRIQEFAGRSAPAHGGPRRQPLDRRLVERVTGSALRGRARSGWRRPAPARLGGGETSLNDPVIDPGRVQLCRCLGGQLAAMAKEQNSLMLPGCLGHDRGGNHRFSRRGRRYQQYPAAAGGDLGGEPRDDFNLVWAQRGGACVPRGARYLGSVAGKQHPTRPRPRRHPRPGAPRPTSIKPPSRGGFGPRTPCRGLGETQIIF